MSSPAESHVGQVLKVDVRPGLQIVNASFEVLDQHDEQFRVLTGIGSGVNFRDHIDAAIDLAMEMDVDLDLHVDLGIPPSVELDELEIVHAARRVIERGYQGRVTAGHVCALDSALPEIAEEAIALIQEAQISVISQPDMYRLGREDTRCTQRADAGQTVASCRGQRGLCIQQCP